jgi:hypothetical protein
LVSEEAPLEARRLDIPSLKLKRKKPLSASIMAADEIRPAESTYNAYIITDVMQNKFIQMDCLLGRECEMDIDKKGRNRKKSVRAWVRRLLFGAPGEPRVVCR